MRKLHLKCSFNKNHELKCWVSIPHVATIRMAKIPLNKIGYVQLTINFEKEISKLESNVHNCQLSLYIGHICHSLTWFLSKCPQMRERKHYWRFNLKLHEHRWNTIHVACWQLNYGKDMHSDEKETTRQ